MEFEIRDIKDNITNVARKIGYLILEAKTPNEYNMVRKLTGQHYPRFHVYCKQAGDRFNFSLHLDQKQPSYEGSHAHSGEYFGPVVEAEKDRITVILQKIKKPANA